ncbi:MAG: ribonuclease P protein component [Egibacteraceae bacterium]
MAVKRLHRSNDIRAVFAARNVAHGRLLSVYGRGANDREQCRIAVVGGRDVGNAVRRNRAKRRLRAAIQIGDLPGGLDLVVRAKPPAVDASFAALRSELAQLLDRVGRRAEGALSTRSRPADTR